MIRHVAQITIEAVTPLKVGSNHSDFLQDSPVQKDFNGLPMILGTSITGVLRKEFSGNDADIFGEENGSKIIISNALLLDNNHNVHESLLLEKSDFLSLYKNLPIREHAAITDKGVARNGAKYDEEVVYAGSRFKFSIEFIEDNKKIFEEILALLKSKSFRLGAGSTKGFGQFKIYEIKTQTFDFETYVHYSSSLNYELQLNYEAKGPLASEHICYKLNIEPEDFFMFGSGFGDSEADMTPVYEKIVDYKQSKLSEKQILIPASSIKGALSHRTAFYYNKMMMKKGKEYDKVGETNDAVKALFGHKKEQDKITKKELGQKGKVIMSDCFHEDKEQVKVFDHVSIDRFTGGAIDGALFQEKTIAQKNKWEIEILVEKSLENTEYLQAFEEALTDVCTGMLSLGGATTKGHGIFCGNLLKNDHILYEGKCDDE